MQVELMLFACEWFGLMFGNGKRCRGMLHWKQASLGANHGRHQARWSSTDNAFRGGRYTQAVVP